MTVHTAPKLTTQQAQALARRFYNLTATATELPSERDQNFRLEDSTGKRYVLKLANGSEDPKVLEFQNRCWMHLAPKGIITPRMVVTSDAREVVEHEGHLVRLFTWIDGEVMARVRPHSDSMLASLGAVLAEIDLALADFADPAMHRTLHWDIRQAHLARQHLPLLTPRRRALVEQYFRAWERIDWSALRHSPIHGDANDYNVIVRDGRVSAILDLGDSVHTATVCDLAIAVAYAMLDKPDPLAVADTIIEAYHQRNPLTDAERSAVMPLTMARLAMSVCYSAFNAREAAEDPYHQVSASGAWRILERMAPVDFAHRSNDRTEELLERRRAHLGSNLSISYTRPLQIVRGWRQYLYDPQWRAYLDCVNNVAHVGHCHPRVVEAIARQSATLNTNTRYLNELLVEYAERLTATLPDPLNAVFLVCSGSEANELALRMARTHTRRHNIMVLDVAYHGNTNELVSISPYKYEGPGGRGRPSWVHQVPYTDPIPAAVEVRGNKVAAFIHESALGCAGQVFLPDGFLEATYAAVRKAGGVCIADEVQTGFGRAGTHFWMFETQDVVPDIVTLGKPIGNGHPMGAVITTPEIAAAFANGMEYFNTFGGNPVSCAAGLAVLDVIREESLQENALETGEYLLQRLRDLALRHSQITDVRGRGLFLGLEMTRKGDIADSVVDRMKELSVLLSTDGPHHNVIKIKPPMCFTREDADTVVDRLDEVLSNG